MEHTPVYELHGILLGVRAYIDACDGDDAQRAAGERLGSCVDRAIQALRQMQGEDLNPRDASGVRDSVWSALRDLAQPK